MQISRDMLWVVHSCLPQQWLFKRFFMFVFLQEQLGLINGHPRKLSFKNAEFVTAKYFHHPRSNTTGYFIWKKYEFFTFFSDHRYLKLVLKNSL